METSTALSQISAGQHHLALICGLPTSLTYFAADLCRDLLARKHGACEVTNLNDLNPETVQRIVAVSGPALFLAEIPDAAVAAMARETEFPIVVVDQEFQKACYDFMAARDANLLDSVRTMARAQMGVLTLADIPRTAVVGANAGEPAAALAQCIAEALDVPAQFWQPLVEDRNLDRPLSEVLDEIFAYEEVPRSDEADELLGKLERFYGLRRDRASAVWDVPLGVLLEAHPPHLPATDTIELLGPARCLIVGPYLYLSPGRWVLRFSFTTADNESSNTLGFDVTADEEVKFVQDYVLTTTGRYEFRCNFSIENAFYPFEFRTFLRRGSIGGRFAAASLIIEPA